MRKVFGSLQTFFVRKARETTSCMSVEHGFSLALWGEVDGHLF